MLALFIALIFCEKKTTIVYVTPKFSVLPVPLEMTEYFISKTLARNDVNDEFVELSSSGYKQLMQKKNVEFTELIQYLLEKCFKHLLYTLPSLELSTEEIDAYWEDTKIYFINTIITSLMTSRESGFCYPNIHINYSYSISLYFRYRYIDQGIFLGMLHVINEIYNSSIEDEKAKECLYKLQKNLKNIWIRKIVTDYIQNNHNQINTTDIRIILYKADFDCYFDKQKINKAFDEINDKIEQENIDEGYILLEPAFYLHSESSLTYNDDKTKKK